MRRGVLGTVALASLALGGCGGDDAAPKAATAPPPVVRKAAAKAPLRTLIGQRLVVGLAGTAPDRNLLLAVRRGEIGGIVLFPRNARSPAQLRSLTARLRAAAKAGGQPRPLVMVDQEGGSVKRIAFAPPDRAAPALGAAGDDAARAEGARTGRALRALGVDVDLAPVADVPASPRSVIAKEGRAFGSTPDVAGARAGAFARGLRDGGVRAALKHFPGLGAATTNTDDARQVLPDPAGEVEAFRGAINAGDPALVMLSWGVYPALDPDHPAGRSTAVVGDLLRGKLGFRGLTITDSLAAKAVKATTTPPRMAVAAARADVDLLLWGGTAYSWHPVRDLLVAAAKAGALKRADLERSYARIVALKRSLP
jgi:beta-N-acetylhexosaminidase